MLLNRPNQSHVNRVKENNDNYNLTRFHLLNFGINITDNSENYTYSTRDPLYIAIPLTILYSFILITGIIGNLITCVVILKNKYLHTTTNYYLFSLAISDLLLLTFGLPQEMYYIWSRYPYIFGETFCILRGLMAETSANATVLTITTFTVERYIAICHPFLAHTMSNLSRAIKFVLAIWVIALVSAIPQALQFGLVFVDGPEKLRCTLRNIIVPHSFELSTLIFFVIPMIAITILYIRIGVKLKHSPGLSQRRYSRPALSAINQSSSQRLLATGQPSKKVLKMLVAVVITFFVCWAPFHIQRLVAIYTIESPENPGSHLMMKIYDVVTYISAILYYTSSTVNPILYHTMSNKFRDAFKQTANNVCCPNYGGKNALNSKRRGAHRSQTIYRHGRKIKILVTDCSSTTDSSTGQNFKTFDDDVNNDIATDNEHEKFRKLSKSHSIISKQFNDRKQIIRLLNCAGAEDDDDTVDTQRKKPVVVCQSDT